MISILFWVAFGSVIGWVAAILQDERARQATLGYIVIGALGGLLGGFLGVFLSPAEKASFTSTSAVMFALFGATALVVITGLARQNNRSGQ